LKRGDIYFVSLDPAFGHEQQGTRPVLVVSSDAFNQLTRLPIVVPITSGGRFARIHGFAVSLISAGTKTTGVVRCDQPRILDISARNGRRVETLSGQALDEVLKRTAMLFQ
jgi:mRNA-degrading endonuclease toxin of MazEF toxin-antitoxin module